MAYIKRKKLYKKFAQSLTRLTDINNDFIQNNQENNNNEEEIKLMIKQSYSTLELIEDLLREISKINKHFSSFSKTKLMEEVSVKIFDKGKNFLKHILSKIRNPSNPN